MAMGKPLSASVQPYAQRLEGFSDELARSQVDFPAAYLKNQAETAQAAHDDFCRMFEMDNPPTGIFAASDSLAIRLLRAARECGVHVPQDVSIIGFDNIEVAEQIGLTSISHRWTTGRTRRNAGPAWKTHTGRCSRAAVAERPRGDGVMKSVCSGNQAWGELVELQSGKKEIILKEMLTPN
jgi:hypothetical protein